MTLDPLSLRIVAALQVDGRASWRRIADALGESSRTVARRGSALLEDGAVRVVGLPSHQPSFVLRLDCEPSSVRAVAQDVASWDESVFVYSIASAPSVVAELMMPTEQVAAVARCRLSATSGVRDWSLHPVARNIRTVAQWRAPVLDDQVVGALQEHDVADEQYRPGQELDDTDRVVVSALVEDGRTSLDSLVAATGLSEPTVRRRLETLLTQGSVHIRAVVAPELLGLPVQAVLEVHDSPSVVAAVAGVLRASSWVRYASLTFGRRRLVADVAVPDLEELERLVEQLGDAAMVRVDLVLDAYKRSGVLAPAA